MEKTFTIKAYATLEAILGFIISMGLGLSLLIDFESFINIKSWTNTLLQGFLVLLTLSSFLFISKIVSYSIQIKIDSVGIYFKHSKSLLGIKRKDKQIAWADIKEWSYAEGHASASAWSPDSFKVKYKPNGKYVFYLTLGRDNNQVFQFFLKTFLQEVENQKLTNQISLKESIPLEETKSYAIVMTCVMLSVIVLMLWFFFFRAETDIKSKESGKIMIPIMTLISIWFSYMSIRKAFYRKID